MEAMQETAAVFPMVVCLVEFNYVVFLFFLSFRSFCIIYLFRMSLSFE